MSLRLLYLLFALLYLTNRLICLRGGQINVIHGVIIAAFALGTEK
jgi:hypothetical protein